MSQRGCPFRRRLLRRRFEPTSSDSHRGTTLYDLVLRDATIVTSSGREVADVAITDGKIVYVGPRPPKRRAKETISAIGKFLIPGVIDTAVQFAADDDPRAWEAESKAAVSGGITTVISLPGGKKPVTDAKSAKARVKRFGKKSFVNFGLWGGATADNADQLREAASEGLILGTLAYMGKHQGIGIEVDELQSHLGSDGVTGVHLNGTVAEGRADEVFARALELTQSKDAEIHLVHLCRAEELHMLDPVKGDLPVTAGVTPHHLFLSEESNDKGVATNPPVRPEHDRKSLWTAMKRGRLDVVASDHHPTQDGVPGAELMFPLMLSAVKYGRLSLELLVSLCSEAPARIFGLEAKGRIEKGADADLVLFSEGELTRVAAGDMLTTGGDTPYLDREAAPKPDMVIVGGKIVCRRGELLSKKPTGQFVQRREAVA